MRLEDRDEPPAEERDVEHDERDQEPRVEQLAHERAPSRRTSTTPTMTSRTTGSASSPARSVLAVVGLADAGKEEREERGRRRARIGATLDVEKASRNSETVLPGGSEV